MKRLLYLLIALLLVACKPDKPEVVDEKDLFESSERYREDEVPTDEMNAEDSTANLKLELRAAGIESKEILAWTLPLFPERFGPESKQRLRFINESDTLYYANLRFKDSVRVMNAVFNWIDCFGPKCKSVYFGQGSAMQKRPFIVFIGDTSLIYLEAAVNLNFENWQKYLENKGYVRDWNVVIEQNKNSVARWYTYEDEKKVKWKK